MKPRDIDLSTQGLPLVGTFGKSEREAAAAYLLMAMQMKNTWAPQSAKDVGDAILRHNKKLREKYPERGVEAGVEFHWLSNPFFQPNFDSLVMKEFAYNEVLDIEGREVVWRGFTEHGIECIRSSPYAPKYEQAATLLKADQ